MHQVIYMYIRSPVCERIRRKRDSDLRRVRVEVEALGKED